MNDKPKIYWCVIDPDGKPLHDTTDRKSEFAIKEFMLYRPLGLNQWKDYKEKGYSCVRVELNELGKHPDTLLAERLLEALEKVGVKYSDGKYCFCAMAIGHPLVHEHGKVCLGARQAIDEATKEKP